MLRPPPPLASFSFLASLAFLAIAALIITTVDDAAGGDSLCEDRANASGDTFPDPYNCSVYYECFEVGGDWIHEQNKCEGVFDYKARTCKPGHCQENPKTGLSDAVITTGTTKQVQPAAPLPRTKSSGQGTSGNKEPFTKCTKTGRFEDVNNCTRYHFCKILNGKLFGEHHKCFKDQHFSTEEEKCIDGPCPTVTQAEPEIY